MAIILAGTVETTPFTGGEATVSQQEVKYEITTPSQSEQLQQSMGLLSMLNVATQNVREMKIILIFEKLNSSKDLIGTFYILVLR